MSNARPVPGRQLDRLFRLGTVGAMTDLQLLEQFVAGGDEAAELAFEALVDRHGPMVFRVCQSVLRDRHAAEDAFQATFLVLARKARSLSSRELLGNWLYGVASRTARKAKAASSRRRVYELQVAQEKPTAMVEPLPEQEQDDWEHVLHQEINRLPGSYRAAVVVCYFGGLTQSQAAQQLHVAESTVRGRLARARRLLHQRLTRRGVALATGLAALDREAHAARLSLATVQARDIAHAALRFVKDGQAAHGVVSVTAQSIAQGVLKTMWLNSLKTIAALVIAVTSFSTGVALLMPRRAGAAPQIEAAVSENSPASAAPAPRSELPTEANLPPSPSPTQNAQTSKPRPTTGKGRRQTQAVAVDPDLARTAPGSIERAVSLSKDCLILAYLPDQNLGGVDNFALANNDGGCRCLIAWPDIPADEAAAPERRFLIALYSRKTTSNPPAGPIHAFELVERWGEFSSWRSQPRYNPEPAATYKFEPGKGWKLFDITSLVRDQAKAGRQNHGILLRFLSEDLSPQKDNWSGYEFVSREGTGEWVSRRPVLLIVKGTKS